jgi:hypothetical protein
LTSNIVWKTVIWLSEKFPGWEYLRSALTDLDRLPEFQMYLPNLFSIPWHVAALSVKQFMAKTALHICQILQLWLHVIHFSFMNEEWSKRMMTET